MSLQDLWSHYFFFSRKKCQSELSQHKTGIRISESNCVDSGHFSVEDRTRDWLLEQGGRTVCRSCREGERNIERASSSTGIAKTIFKEERQEEGCVKQKTEEEGCAIR